MFPTPYSNQGPPPPNNQGQLGFPQPPGSAPQYPPHPPPANSSGIGVGGVGFAPSPYPPLPAGGNAFPTPGGENYGQPIPHHHPPSHPPYQSPNVALSYPTGPALPNVPLPSNPVFPSAGSYAPQWVECRTPEGRIYYYDSVSKQSVWQRPNTNGAPIPACTIPTGVVHRTKEEAKRFKKMEKSFGKLLKHSKIDHECSWEQVRPRLERERAFIALPTENDRIHVFKNYQERRLRKYRKKGRKSYSSSSSSCSSDDEHKKYRKSKK